MNETEIIPWTRLSADANGDGSVTIRDVPTFLLDLLMLPGDAVLHGLLTYVPDLAKFLELGEADYGGPFSIGMSVAIWLLALIAAGVALTAVRNFDRNLTAFIAARFADTRRHCRVLRRRLSVWATGLFGRSGSDGVRVEPLMLAPIERAVLRCLTNIDDGTVLTIEELATQLNRPRPQVRAAHFRLRELKLIEHGEDTYAKRAGLRITTAGQMVLIGH